MEFNLITVYLDDVYVLTASTTLCENMMHRINVPTPTATAYIPIA